jgi:Domain of Unknown Function with PDB structure (DUF3857)/Transglutaminase-like superfamily
MANRLTQLFCLLLALTCFTETSYGQDMAIPKEYFLASGIPDSLKENANSVMRYSKVSYNIKGPGKATVKWHNVITILNEKGDKESEMVMGYNKKYDTYSNIEMRVYNADGAVIKKYHKADMYDGSATSGSDLVTDERFLGVRHTVASYPTTIETEYEEDESSFIDLNALTIQGIEQSVQNFEIEVMVNAASGFRFKTENITGIPEKKSTDGIDDYTWAFRNLKAIKKEENVLSWKVVPRIRFAVNSFNCYGYPGDFSSWQSFGKWLQGLNSDVSSLTPEREAEIKKMTDSIKTDKAKAKFLYNYLQQNVRYVSVQLGIGGFKPFPATFVDQKKYGDCKALSNYMRALLKAVNINAYYTIVRAGSNEEPADFSFPANTFNHVILCIPFKNDTTWLECTSNTQPFGKLGPFTENRNALLVTEDGGKLVNTPRSTMDDNQFNSESHIVIEPDGGANAKIKILSSGEYRFDYINYSYLKLDEQKEMYMHALNIRQPSVFNLNAGVDKDGVKEVDINLEYDKFSDIIAGNKQFYRPRVFDLCAFTVPIEEKRKTDFYFEHPLKKTCVTTIDLPVGFEVETLPVDQSLKFTYGNYEVKYVYDAAKNQVISTAKFNLTNHVIPADKYTEMQQYLDAVAKAQNKKLVIRRKA